MDRLVCGDVGFGKTEVAIRRRSRRSRTASRPRCSCPTTLLASAALPDIRGSLRRLPDPGRGAEPVPHARSGPAGGRGRAKRRGGLRDRHAPAALRGHPVLGSRPARGRRGAAVRGQSQGADQADRATRSTSSRSPPPRSPARLEMSLTGIRDLTLLHTPPAERQPILTYVGEEDERAVAEAIRRELLREGQVFFVHNRVRDIENIAAGCASSCPRRGSPSPTDRWTRGTLEKIVFDFWEGRFDVLVCTTIIESGIDMPTVNTLVVDRADLLGLGQLHQLRGRVGRAGQRAYAYLFHPRDRSLTEEAYERLKTIGESTELGSGLPHRDARPRDPRCGHAARHRPDRPHRSGRVRPVLPDGQRGRGRAEGRAEAGAGRGEAGPAPRRPPPARLRGARRSCASRPTGVWRRSRPRRRSTTSVPSGRTATARCRSRQRSSSRSAACGRSASGSASREVNVTKGPAFGGPAHTARVAPVQPQDESDHPSRSTVQGRRLQGRLRAVGAARAEDAGPGGDAGRLPS